MKIIFFTKYSRLGASSRLRSYQYFPYLEKEGFEITAKPLFDSTYIKDLLRGEKSISTIFKSYFNRLIILLTISKYEHVVIEKELFPYLPALAEYILLFLGIQYTVIYDDAIFHNYDLNKNKAIRFFLKNKIDKVMKYSACAIVGNSYLAERAKKAGAKRIEIIPTVIDVNKYTTVNKSHEESFVIGWIGSPSTFIYLKQLEPILNKITNKYNNISIHVVGTNEKLNIDTKVNYIIWSEEAEVREIQKFDIGIMPLNNTPWELGKCSYKLIQYMGCGKPVIASAIGMNLEVVSHGENGYLVNNEKEWMQYLETLIQNRSNIKQMGAKGREIVEDKYSLEGSYKCFLKAILNTNN